MLQSAQRIFRCILAFTLLAPTAFATSTVVHFTSADGVKLNARLLNSANSSKKKPGILLLEGSGKSSLDQELESSPLNQLSKVLHNQKYVVLAYNKRGSGENSTNGSFWKATFSTYQEDAQRALDYLKSLKTVDSNRIFIIGHDYGGTHALKLAETNKLSGVMLLNTSIRSAADLQLEQCRIRQELKGVSQKNINDHIQTLGRHISRLKEDTFSCTKPECEEIEGIPVYRKFLPIPWWKEVLKLDFTEWALKLKIPTLFIYGTSDFVIPKTDYFYVRDIIRLHKPSHIQAIQIQNMDHYFLEQPDMEGSYKYRSAALQKKEYKPISPHFVREVIDWLKKHSS